jgi:uncharacterized integral membrane protein
MPKKKVYNVKNILSLRLAYASIVFYFPAIKLCLDVVVRGDLVHMKPGIKICWELQKKN